MRTNDPYAKAPVWDSYHAMGEELNPQGWWVPNLLPFRTAAGRGAVLEGGCGTGGDAGGLGRSGFHVTAMDSSEVALARARAKAKASGVVVDFQQGDMALPFPFADSAFDAVMSNVALHMFDDQTTRRIIGEMRRVLRPSGLLLLHVNSTEDMPYREERLGRLRVQTLEPNFYRAANGQTMPFFSEQYCRNVLADWTMVELTHQRLRDEAGTIIKRRLPGVVAQKTSLLSTEE